MRLLVPKTTCLARSLLTAASKARLQALLLLAVGSLTIPSLHAQWAVVDSGAIAEITTVASEVSSEISQLQQTYNLAQQMATSAQGMWRFQGPTDPWQDFHYTDQYGTLSNWGTAVNSGNLSAIQSAYTQATQPVGINQNLSGLNQAVVAALQAGYSAQEIMDGNTMSGMSTIGQIHASAAQYQDAIAQLQNDDENPDPDLQSELAVEQRTSNALVLGLQAQQDTNQILSDILQQQLAQNLVTRNEMVSEANASVGLQNALQSNANLTNGYANSLQNWSIVGSQ
jgi:hypothetical protein